MQKMIAILAALGFTFSLAACDSGGGIGEKPDTDEPKVVDGKEDAWNYTNNPSRFQLQFDYGYADLIQYTAGTAEQAPWPSDYWSYYEDSINVRYHGSNELSPAEKYDVAFNNWTPDMNLQPLDVSADCTNGLISDKHDDYYNHLGPAAKWQHENKGIYAARNGRDDDGDGQTDECGDDYDGIETWWGLCHAWVPASILEAEPQHDVVLNGVTFTVSDIKALLIAQYDRSSAHMLGGRCNEKELERDDQGRLTQDECRDTNAGAFFVVITNMLGRDKRAFAEDRTGGYQVWNQPVLKYNISENTELTEDEAVEKLGQPAGTDYNTTFDSPDAEKWYFIRMSVGYITESSNTTEGPLVGRISSYTRNDNYQLIVEVDKDGNVVGGEWIGYSRETHPDFLWLPTQGHGGNPNISLPQVRELLALSRLTDQPDPENETARKFGEDIDFAIPDNDPNGVVYTYRVDEDIAIDSLKVGLKIDHTYIGDLRVVLSKDGKSVTLHDKTGGGTDNIDQTYDVHEWDSASAQGEWTLTLSDHANRDVGALKNFTLFIRSGTSGSATTGHDYANQNPVDIPDNDEDGVESVISVNDAGVIKTMKVDVNITHTYIGDLIVTLEHNGQVQVLCSREGGSDDDLAKTFPVTTFVGAPIKGDWVLKVTDKAGQDVGVLNNWSLKVEMQ